MKLFNWVSRRIRSRGQKRPAVHLNFELCEERFLLTGFLVNSAADTDTGTDTTGTLRHGILLFDAGPSRARSTSRSVPWARTRRSP